MVQVHLVVTQRNRAESIPWSLSSVLTQTYKELRVTYVDDASTDNSASVLQEILTPQRRRPVTLVLNDTRRGVIANILSAVQDDPNDTVVVLLDGDDALAHPLAVERIAREYEDSSTWFTYGHFLSWPDRQVIYDGAYHPTCIHENHFREWFWRCAPPRSFRVGLLRAVPDSYLRDDDGCYWEYANDQGLILPMLELARYHIQHIPDVLYLYDTWNWNKPSREQFEALAACVKRIRDKPKLSALTAQPW